MKKWEKPKLTILVKVDTNDSSLHVELPCKFGGGYGGGPDYRDTGCASMGGGEGCPNRCSELTTS